MAKATSVKIDPEFKGLISPCTPEERAGIRQSIVDFGLLSPLVVWEETGILLDGHNRYEICLEIKHKPRRDKDWRFVSLPNRKAARIWILKNQVDRRNLHPDQLSIIRARIYEERKQSEPFREVPVRHNGVPIESTAAVVAEEFGVSPRTINRDVQFRQGVATLPPDIAAEVEAGKSPLPRKDIIALAPIMCERCKRHGGGPKPGCEKCEAAQLAHKAKKNAKDRKDRAAKPKPGSMKADWAKFERDFGPVMRFLDEVANGYGIEKNKGVVEDIRNTLKDFYQQVMDLKKTLTKGEGS